MQTRRQALRQGLALAGLAATSGSAKAQDSSKPLRIVVGFAPGGSTDLGARTVAPLLEQALKRPVIVENRPGGSGVIAVQTLLSAPADGNTLYMQSTAVTTRVFIKDFQVDVMRDMEPVAPLWSFSYVLFANSSVPVQTMQQFVEYARSRKGGLNYAASTPSGMLTTEMLKAQAGIDMVSVLYKGSAPAALGMLANDVQVTFDALASYRQHLETGKVRALMFTGKQRNPALPQVPTAAEAGLPELQVSLTGGLWAKAGAPPAQVARINAAINDISQRPDVKQRFEQLGWETVGGSADDLRRQVASEMTFWERAAKLIDYRPD